jgi:hypothetical protein
MPRFVLLSNSIIIYVLEATSGIDVSSRMDQVCGCRFPHAQTHELRYNYIRVENVASVDKCPRCRFRELFKAKGGFLCSGKGADSIDVQVFAEFLQRD